MGGIITGPVNRFKWSCYLGGSSPALICHDYNPNIDDCAGGLVVLCVNTGINCRRVECA